MIADQKKKFQEVKKIVEKGTSDIENSLGQLQLKKRHSTIDATEFLAKLRTVGNDFLDMLKSQEDLHPGFSDSDKIRDRLDALFGGRIGKPPGDQAFLDRLADEGAKRYEAKIPPGYRDLTKKGEIFTHQGLLYRREYGDLILWKQLIQYCKDSEIRQVIFVTDDDKEDWWWSLEASGTKRIGPRPELREELARETNIERFFMLGSERFAQNIAKALNLQLAASTIQQVRDVKETLIAEEKIKCPSCGMIGSVMLGVATGSSAIHYCDGCGSRFHVHRKGEGQVFAREWGGVHAGQSSKVRVEAVCPTCNGLVPANIFEGEATTDRYCMKCCSLLTIDYSGNVVRSCSSAPVPAASVAQEGRFTFLGCPNCYTETRTITTVQLKVVETQLVAYCDSFIPCMSSYK